MNMAACVSAILCAAIMLPVDIAVAGARRYFAALQSTVSAYDTADAYSWMDLKILSSASFPAAVSPDACWSALDLSMSSHRPACHFIDGQHRVPHGLLTFPAATSAAPSNSAAVKAAASLKLRSSPAVKTRSGGYRGIIPLGYVGASDRYGNFYLPGSYRSRALPVMVILHGSGMNGLMMVLYYSWLADKYGCVLASTPVISLCPRPCLRVG